jgi:hypothetical protein
VLDFFARLFEAALPGGRIVGAPRLETTSQLLHGGRQDEYADGMWEFFLDLAGALVVDVE